MKRYIIITAMLVLSLGLNAQRTTTGTRTTTSTTSTTRKTDDDRKASPAKTETRTKESTPAKTRTTVTTKSEDKPVRSATTPRKVEPAVENRSTGTTKARTETTRPADPARQAGSTNRVSTPGQNRNSGEVRPTNSQRVDGNSREVNVEKNREYVPRTEPVYVEKRQTYRTPERPRIVRTETHSTTYVHHPVEYRRTYYPYAEPRHIDVIWDYNMYNEYRYLYPQYDYWYYPLGYRIQTISAYDADRYVGEVARIYGKVYEVWYERQTDEYTIYFGGPYPYQDFSIILPGKYARRYSHNPVHYFTDRNVAVTGLVSLWEDKPEMLIKKKSQIEVYF